MPDTSVISPRVIKSLREKAKKLKKSSGITHHEALDLIARSCHCANWPHLMEVAKMTALTEETHGLITGMDVKDARPGKKNNEPLTRRILVVEDDPINMIFAVTVLEHAGHEVLQAGDAAAGIRLAREAHPDLVFIDIKLHGMDGLEATRQLKADPATRHIPIYALTAFAAKGEEERVRAAGCDGYLAKPASYKDLLAVAGKVTNIFKGE